MAVLKSEVRNKMFDRAVKVKDKFGAQVARTIIKSVGKVDRLNQIHANDYHAVIEAFEQQLEQEAPPKRKTEMPAAIAAPYGTTASEANTKPRRLHARTDDIHHLRNDMSIYSVGLPGDLDVYTSKLALDSAHLMGQKLLKSQEKFGDNWSLPGWAETDIRYQAFKHMLKGDPVDVMNYMAFLSFHGNSARPQSHEEAMALAALFFEAFPAEEAAPELFVNVEGIKVEDRESAQKLVELLQKKYDLVDDNAMLRQVMDKMEERHGEEFDAFFGATIRQVMIGSGMTELQIDTAAVMQTLILGGTLVCTEAPGKLIYHLAGENDQIEYDAAGKFVGVIRKDGQNG